MVLSYTRNKKYPNVIRKRISIDTFKEVNCTISEGHLPFSYSPMSYNFTLGKGTLRNGYGIKEYSFSEPIPYADFSCQGIFFYKRNTVEGEKDDRLLLATTGGVMYEYALYKTVKWKIVGSFSTESVISAINYCYDGNYYFIFAGDSFQYVYDGTLLREITDSPLLGSLCVHSDRVFATTGGENSDAVWFSDDFNPTNWQVSLSEGGYIRFDDEGGRVLSVVEFLDSVFVFREYAIIRIRGYISQADFNVSKIYVCTGRIFPNTITVCGDKIVYTASDGMYYFNGADVVRVKEGITPLVEYTSKTKAYYHSTKYYLATGLKLDNAIKNEGENNGLLIYDTIENTVNIVAGMDIRSIASLMEADGEKLLAICEDIGKVGVLSEYDGTLFGKPLRKYWRTPNSDFGLHGYKKRLKKLIVRCDADITIFVKAKGKEERIRLLASDKEQIYRLNFPFEKTYLELISDSRSCNLEYVDMEIEVCK